MVRRLAPWLLPLVTAWIAFCTLRAAAHDRIRSLDVVEGYGFAVYEQIIHNRAFTGRFFQTVHRGYTDHWMWSGHRSVFVYLTAELYRLAPSPDTLTSFQVGLVALGCLPAFGLGQRMIGGTVGGAVGLLLYAGYPPLWAIALNDYQDLVLGIPFVLAAAWALRAGSGLGFLLAAFAAACTREEWAATLPLLGLAAPGAWRPRLRGVALGLVAAAAFVALAAWLGRDADGYETPLATLTRAALTHPPPLQRTAADGTGFYLHFLRPIFGVAALAPLSTLPGVGALLVHLTAPRGSGIDVDWRGHIHHMAPVATFLVLGTIDGLGVLASLLRPPPGLGRLRAMFAGRNAVPWPALLVVGLGLAAVFAGQDASWARRLGLSPTASPVLHDPPDLAPEWALVAPLSDDVVIATDMEGALLVGGFTRSFTYDESLRQKSRIGLAELDYLLVRRRDTDALVQAQALGGRVVSGTSRYQLVRMPRAR